MIANFRTQERDFTMEALYQSAGITRQAIWDSNVRDRQTLKKEESIAESVMEYRANHPRMGSRVLYHTIQNNSDGLEIGVNKFESFMSEKGLTMPKLKSWVPKTSDGRGKRNYPNLANGLVLNDINQLLVSDITYYDMCGTFQYIFSIKDVYSQRMLVILPAQTLEAKHLVKCIEILIEIRGKDGLKNCIFHSDNGGQYESLVVVALLVKELSMRLSRSQTCQQNGSSEQSHNMIKNMYLVDKRINTFEQLCKECKRIEKLVNDERAVKQLKYMSPIMFENSLKDIPLESRVKKTLHDFENKV